MRCLRGVGILGILLAMGAGEGHAQPTGGGGHEAYFGAVAEFFDLPPTEVAILGAWRLPADEIPVVLFVARRAGISPEALVALRGSGRGWAELAKRYHLDASHFHVPIPDGADAGRLASAYSQYRSLPTARWAEVILRDEDIVALVNVRLLAQTLRRPPEQVAAAGGAGSWAEVYGRLLGGIP